MALKRIVEKDGSIYFIDANTGNRVQTSEDVLNPGSKLYKDSDWIMEFRCDNLSSAKQGGNVRTIHTKYSEQPIDFYAQHQKFICPL
jgi:hypothetical protein